MASFAARASTMVESHVRAAARTAATQAIVVAAAALEALIPATQEQLRGLRAFAHRTARQASVVVQKGMMATPARKVRDAPRDLRA